MFRSAIVNGSIQRRGDLNQCLEINFIPQFLYLQNASGKTLFNNNVFWCSNLSKKYIFIHHAHKPSLILMLRHRKKGPTERSLIKQPWGNWTYLWHMSVNQNQLLMYCKSEIWRVIREQTEDYGILPNNSVPGNVDRRIQRVTCYHIWHYDQFGSAQKTCDVMATSWKLYTFKYCGCLII